LEKVFVMSKFVNAVVAAGTVAAAGAVAVGGMLLP
jgi:hypothetical protein